MITNDEILTLDEAAKMLKVSRPTMYRKIKSGEIPAKKVGRGWRFLRSSLLNLLESQKKDKVDIPSSLACLDFKKIGSICKKYYIALCYIFGSQTTGEADKKSDIDIGVVFLPNVNLEKKLLLFTGLKDELVACVRVSEIDLIFLQDIGPLVQEQAILGECIYSVSDFFKTRYEDRVATEAMDFRFFQRRFDKEMAEDIKKGGFFAA